MAIFSKLFDGLYYKGGIFIAGLTCVCLAQKEILPRSFYSVAFGMTGVGAMGLLSGFHMLQDGEDENNTRRSLATLGNQVHVFLSSPGVILLIKCVGFFSKLVRGLYYRGGIFAAGIVHLCIIRKENFPSYAYSISFGAIGTGLIGMIAGYRHREDVEITEILVPKRYRMLVDILFYRGTILGTGLVCLYLTRREFFPIQVYNLFTGMTIIGLVGIIIGYVFAPEDPHYEERMEQFYKLKPELERALREQAIIMLELRKYERRLARLHQIELQSRRFDFFVGRYEQRLPEWRRTAPDMCLLRDEPDKNILIANRSNSLGLEHIVLLSKYYCVF